ncbi:Short-chain dehydrogenase/reductase SDR [Penicillium cinerascens]|uniref:Short-chain dehydrogenase/reductase SDR n=1 Tax=Penicillium cinerascens TaxID=70096 RepID=A0A9W9J605_9EURO|nr:Short-chain dehydrogenase/reductase SDR [Penicillium cinerascens]KAJ5190399.1 Short-chain dehydrogenase/reductase SDR [Penicillium cinerascens]
MTTPSPLSGKVILITGAGNGIGRATSIKLASEGASLALSDIDLASVNETAAQCVEQRPAQSHTINEVDVSNVASVNAWVMATVSRYGRLDHIFNCAGINPIQIPTVDTTDEYSQRLISVNLGGTFNVCRACIPHLLSGSSVVNVSSIVGVQPRAGMAIYAATKAGIIGLSKSMAMELGPQGIRVNVVAPGEIYTATNVSVIAGEETVQRAGQKVALGRLGRPDEIADVVIWMFQSSYMNGSVIEVNGGVE